MFFSDYARSCVWRAGQEAERRPRPDRHPAVRAGAPRRRSTCSTGPGGDLYYVDYGLDDDGVPTESAGRHAPDRLHRQQRGARPPRSPPTRLRAGAADRQLQRRAPRPTPTATPDLRLGPRRRRAVRRLARRPRRSGPTPVGTYTVGLRVDDGHGHTSTATQQIQAGNSRRPSARSRPPSTLTWAVGDNDQLRGLRHRPAAGRHAGARRSRWKLSIRHCPSGVCHTHPLRPSRACRRAASTRPTTSTPRTCCSPSPSPTAAASPTPRPSSSTRRPSRSASRAHRRGPPSRSTAPTTSTPYSETFIQGSQFTVTAAPTPPRRRRELRLRQLVGRRRPVPRVLGARRRPRPTPRRTRARTGTPPRPWPPTRRRGPRRLRSTSRPAPPIPTVTTPRSPSRGTSTTTASSTTAPGQPRAARSPMPARRWSRCGPPTPTAAPTPSP